MAISRVGGITLGGSPARQSGRDGLSRLGSALGGIANITAIFERREREAQRTTALEASASLFETLTSYDRNPATADMDPMSKLSKFDEIIDKSATTLGETDKAAAAELRQQGMVWREKLIADDRARYEERSTLEAMDVRGRVLDQARDELKGAAEDLFDTTNPGAPGRAAATLDTIRKRYQQATQDLPPALRAAVDKEFEVALSKASVSSFLEGADDPVQAYARLRSNKDEVDVGGGQTYNLSGPMTPKQIDAAISNDMRKRSEVRTMQNQARIDSENQRKENDASALRGLKGAIYNGTMSESQAREVISDPDTPADVAESLEVFLDQKGGREAREDARDPEIWKLADSYERAITNTSTMEELAQRRQEVLNDDSLGSMVPTLLESIREREQKLGQVVDRAGEATFARQLGSWKATGEAAVNEVGGIISDRMTGIEANPAAMKQREAHYKALEVSAETLFKRTKGAAGPVLDILMPMAYEEVNEKMLDAEGFGGGEQETTPQRWQSFMESLGRPGVLDAVGKMPANELVDVMRAARVLPAKMAANLKFTDAGGIDLEATVLAVEEMRLRERESVRAAMRQIKWGHNLTKVGNSAKLAGRGTTTDEDLDKMGPS